MKLLVSAALIILPFQTAGCQVFQEDRSDWLIPQEKVFDGEPPKDGIPALSSPSFIPAADVTYLADEDLVIGMMADEGPRAYPHPILDWHEIINDRFGGQPVSLTYCPLTGSGIAWSGNIGRNSTTFGVSGLLYSTNLIAYDRATDSYWSQMRLECVGGKLKGTEAGTYPAVETSWKTWKEMFPASRVVSAETGHRRDYGRYPYGPYKTSDDLLFEVENEDDRLPKKERVFGVLINGKATVYRISAFTAGDRIVEDNVGGAEIVIVGNAERNFVVAYMRRTKDGRLLSFRSADGPGGVVMSDSDGTTRDLFGRGIDGPGKGTVLSASRSFVAYWFAWAAFYPEVEIHQPD